MNKYVYIVDDSIPLTFSNRKKANEYLDDMIEVLLDEGYRLKVDDHSDVFFGVLRFVELTKRGNGGETKRYRIIQSLVR